MENPVMLTEKPGKSKFRYFFLWPGSTSNFRKDAAVSQKRSAVFPAIQAALSVLDPTLFQEDRIRTLASMQGGDTRVIINGL